MENMRWIVEYQLHNRTVLIKPPPLKTQRQLVKARERQRGKIRKRKVVEQVKNGVSFISPWSLTAPLAYGSFARSASKPSCLTETTR